MNAAGVAAGCVTAVYLVVVAIAANDGAGGLEVPARVAGLAITAIVVLSIFASGAWLVDRANRFATEIYIRPIIRIEMEQLRPGLVDEISGNVAARLGELQSRDARQVAQSVATLTIAGVRQAVADEVEDRMQHVLAAGRRYGALMEATQSERHYASTGTDHGISGPIPKPAGRATVHHLPRQADRDTDE